MLSLLLGQFAVQVRADSDGDGSHEFSEPRSLKLDYSGVRCVVFNVRENKLRVDASPHPQPVLSGYVCATSEAQLAKLTLQQERQGDRLLVSLLREEAEVKDKEQPPSDSLRSYGYMDLRVAVPLEIGVEVNVTSGDAWVTGAHSLTAKVGSGELEARRIPGAVILSVGSGEVELRDIGSLTVGSIGSGEVDVENVRGLVRVNSIGSGAFDLEGADGDVKIEAVGNGEVDLERVRGSVTVGSLGAGDLEVEDVAGDFIVKERGHGRVEWRRVGGVVEIPQQR
ncbi:DUF4097 family beta strand repeat-containing protein [Cephaloticoccus capnophilus]|uniref:DUF4097 family beta strand repeat-containing protein n=1 Tax=Cephaloticoccus capnophilus TaxID=1548208 RepID=UPI0012E86F10|nr:hypothetical protein [Cephaloticoccus capnophilus]